MGKAQTRPEQTLLIEMRSLKEIGIGILRIAKARANLGWKVMVMIHDSIWVETPVEGVEQSKEIR